jgi:hypothetical protein
MPIYGLTTRDHAYNVRRTKWEPLICGQAQFSAQSEEYLYYY